MRVFFSFHYLQLNFYRNGCLRNIDILIPLYLQEEAGKISFLSRTFVFSERVGLFYHRYNNISIYFLQFGYILLFFSFQQGQRAFIRVQFRFIRTLFAECVFPKKTFFYRYNFQAREIHFARNPPSGPGVPRQ